VVGVSGLVVVALGGNALAGGPSALDPDDQLRRLDVAVEAIAPLARDRALVVTHGNGPQVGLLADPPSGAGVPLDVADAETEGLIGYALLLALHNRLAPEREVVALLTRTLVGQDDPAFGRPTKPIGRPGADGRRRLVPSPEPVAILEQSSIGRLARAGAVVVCVGGGGIPVAEDDVGRLHGVEAVVDKDLASALLATGLDADHLLLLTDVDAVYDDWGTASVRPIAEATPSGLRRRAFAAGSMAPKVEAAARFVEGGGRRAAIGALGDAAGLLAGSGGTQVRAER
jgi:carbamate kinase